MRFLSFANRLADDGIALHMLGAVVMIACVSQLVVHDEMLCWRSDSREITVLASSSKLVLEVDVSL